MGDIYISYEVYEDDAGDVHYLKYAMDSLPAEKLENYWESEKLREIKKGLSSSWREFLKEEVFQPYIGQTLIKYESNWYYILTKHEVLVKCSSKDDFYILHSYATDSFYRFGENYPEHYHHLKGLEKDERIDYFSEEFGLLSVPE